VYEFHQNNLILDRENGLERVIEALQLSQETEEIQKKIVEILKKYQEFPILLDKNITLLIRGDEGFPEPILIKNGNYWFKLYAAIDCIFREPDGTLHILDFKTGKSDFDLRQGYVYLLAASYLYPGQPAVASFYNLETGKKSEGITATPTQLKAIKIEFVQVAQKHQKSLESYRKNPDLFAQIFPPNPGYACRHCSFNSICERSIVEVSV
jgi:CRISPR/Cas system-associated exonuclease Cas4 (RecB family)